MPLQTINWADVYASLQLDTVKTTGKWILSGILIIGFIVVGLSFLLFRKQPLIGAMLGIGFLIFASKYAVGLWRMSQNPVIYTGVVTDKPQNNFTNETTFESYPDYYLQINVLQAFEIDKIGRYPDKNRYKKMGKWHCPESIYLKVQTGDTITIVVTPHDRSIAKIFKL